MNFRGMRIGLAKMITFLKTLHCALHVILVKEKQYIAKMIFELCRRRRLLKKKLLHFITLSIKYGKIQIWISLS